MAAMQTVKLFIIMILMLSSSLYSQSPFEGKIVLQITGDETANLDYFVKGENIRVEMDADGNEGVLLFNRKNKKTIMMMPEQNMYMEFDANQYMGQIDPAEDDEMEDIKRTGEYKDINGYRCEKWLYTEDDNLTEAWMTEELGNFYMMMNPMDKGAQEKWKQKLQGSFFPMKVTVTENGKKTSSMEVISVTEMSLKDELFKVSPGMQKFEMPNMNMLKQN